MTRYFTKEHEWLDVEGDTATVGITVHAQAQLGDITFVELPAVGTVMKEGDAAAVVESVKAASDVFSPAAGTVSAVNDALVAAPEQVNAEAEAGGWLFRLTLTDAGVPSGLMDDAAYRAYAAEL